MPYIFVQVVDQNICFIEKSDVTFTPEERSIHTKVINTTRELMAKGQNLSIIPHIKGPLGKMLSPKMAPKSENRSSLLILNTYRMWVAGKDSNCRDKKSSLCLSWCFCSSESVGCLDSSSNSPGTQTKSLSTFLNGPMGQRGSDLCSSGLGIYSKWKPGWSKLALQWALMWCGYVCGFILFLQVSTHLHYCQPEYLGCLRCPASWRDTPPLPPRSHWLSVRKKLELGGP